MPQAIGWGTEILNSGGLTESGGMYSHPNQTRIFLVNYQDKSIYHFIGPGGGLQKLYRWEYWPTPSSLEYGGSDNTLPGIGVQGVSGNAWLGLSSNYASSAADTMDIVYREIGGIGRLHGVYSNGGTVVYYEKEVSLTFSASSWTTSYAVDISSKFASHSKRKFSLAVDGNQRPWVIYNNGLNVRAVHCTGTNRTDRTNLSNWSTSTTIETVMGNDMDSQMLNASATYFKDSEDEGIVVTYGYQYNKWRCAHRHDADSLTAWNTNTILSYEPEGYDYGTIQDASRVDDHVSLK